MPNDINKLTEEEILSLVDSTPLTNLPSAPGMVGPGEAPGRIVTPSERLKMIAEGFTGEGVPLDVETGAPFGARLKMAFQPTVEEKIESLRRSLPQAESIRLDLRGKPIIRVPDEETGEMKDMYVDEHDLTLGDLADLAGGGTRMIGGLLAAFLVGKRFPLAGKGKAAKALQQAVAGAVGFSGAGAITDVGARLLKGETISVKDLPEIVKPGEIAKRRGTEAAIDVPLDLVTGGTAALTKRAFQIGMKPHGGVNLEEHIVSGRAAAERIYRQTGEIYTPSVGEATGSQFFQRTETFLEKLPGGTGPLRRAARKRERQLRDIQAALFEGRNLPSDEAIGTSAVQRLRAVAENQENLTIDKQRAAIDEIGAVILRHFDDASIAARITDREAAGQVIRQKIRILRDAFKEESDRLYNRVYALPGADDPIIPTKIIRNRFKDIISELPKRHVITNLPTGLVDAQGDAIVRKQLKAQLLKEYVPTRLKRFLTESTKLDPNMRLRELVQMRVLINDAINESEALPGISNRFLKMASSAITDAIEQGASSPNAPPGFAERLREATFHYKNNFSKFTQPGISDSLVDPKVSGSIGDFEIYNRIVAGKGDVTLYNRYKELLGPNSVETKLLKRGILDGIIRESQVGANLNMIDPKAFQAAIHRVHPEILNDILGSKKATVIRDSQLLSAAKGEIDSDQFSQLILGPETHIRKLMSAMAEQKKLKELYRNELMRDFAKGDMPTAAIRPSEFIDKFVDNAPIEDIREVMSLVSGNPDILNGIRRKWYSRFFASAASAPSKDEIAISSEYSRMGLRNDTAIPTARAMRAALNQPGAEDKARVILGADGHKRLIDFISVINMRDTRQAGSVAAGTLAAGTIIGSLFSFPPKLSNMARMIGYRAAGLSLASDTMHKYLSNTDPIGSARDAFILGMGSTPFIYDLFEQTLDRAENVDTDAVSQALEYGRDLIKSTVNMFSEGTTYGEILRKIDSTQLRGQQGKPGTFLESLGTAQPSPQSPPQRTE